MFQYLAFLPKFFIYFFRRCSTFFRQQNTGALFLYGDFKSKCSGRQHDCSVYICSADRKECVIITTGLAGGLFCPYKGLLPATSQDVLNYSPSAHLFLQALKGHLFFFPVNGSIYSFRLACDRCDNHRRAQPLTWLMLIAITMGMCLMNGYAVFKEQEGSSQYRKTSHSICR